MTDYAKEPQPEGREESMDLETAKTVVSAHHRAEQEKHVEQQRAFIGHCFKYHNSYSGDERWWLYVMVTSVNEWGHLLGWKFERTSSDEVRIDRSAYISALSGWKEIEPAEFWDAALSLSKIVMAQLTGGRHAP